MGKYELFAYFATIDRYAIETMKEIVNNGLDRKFLSPENILKELDDGTIKALLNAYRVKQFVYSRKKIRDSFSNASIKANAVAFKYIEKELEK